MFWELHVGNSDSDHFTSHSAPRPYPPCPTIQAEGRLEEKLHEMYRWGKQYGWDPVVYVNGVPQPAASAGVVSVAPVM